MMRLTVFSAVMSPLVVGQMWIFVAAWQTFREKDTDEAIDRWCGRFGPALTVWGLGLVVAWATIVMLRLGTIGPV